MRVTAFPPILGPAPQLLILGSLPGAASLTAGQYYAHPRNQFWQLMGSVVGAHPELPYSQRCDRLRDAGVAVWDVLHAAVRPGSLDASIVAASALPNDFASLFASEPGIRLIAFNGATAAKLFARLSPPARPAARPTPKIALRYLTLPSTSPAHASLSCAQKLQRWRLLGEYCRPPVR